MMTSQQRSSRAFAISAVVHALFFLLYLKFVVWAPSSATSLISSVDFLMNPEKFTPPPMPKELVQIPTPTFPKARMAGVSKPLALAKLDMSKQFTMPSAIKLSEAKGKVTGPKKEINFDMNRGPASAKLAGGGLGIKLNTGGAHLAQGAALEEVGARRALMPTISINSGGPGGGGGKLIGADNALAMDDEPAAKPKPVAVAAAPVAEPASAKRKKQLDAFGMMSGDYDIEGPLTDRKILKHDAIPFPKWARGRPIAEAIVSIKIWVTPEGKVASEFRVVRTSGYADLDKYVTEELRKWAFEPLPPDAPLQKQWGVITINFENK